MGRIKRIWYLSPMRAAKVQASLRFRSVSPEPPLLAHTSSESRGTFRQKPRSLAPLNGWACAVKICHDGMLEDTNSLDAAHMIRKRFLQSNYCKHVSVYETAMVNWHNFNNAHPYQRETTKTKVTIHSWKMNASKRSEDFKQNFLPSTSQF